MDGLRWRKRLRVCRLQRLGHIADALRDWGGLWRTARRRPAFLARMQFGEEPPLWYLTDNLGSVRDIVSSAGSQLDHIVYDSFGNIVTETNAANGDRFKFAGMQYDSTTSQYFDNRRDGIDSPPAISLGQTRARLRCWRHEPVSLHQQLANGLRRSER